MSEKTLLLYLSKWCAANNFKLSVCGVQHSTEHTERKFFQKILGPEETGWRYFPNDKAGGCYALVDATEIIVFVDSTLGYESISRGKKTGAFSRYLEINCVDYCPFGWPKDLPARGPFWSDRPSQAEVNRIMDHLKSLTQEAWEAECRPYANDLMRFDSNNLRLKRLLDQLLPS